MNEPGMNHERLLQRFLRYVRIDTTAGDGSQGYPSSPGQLELGRLLADELSQIGLTDVEQDRYGIVLASLPSRCRHDVPTIVFNAHLDTSPETTGANVQPQAWKNYQGGDLTLPGDRSQVIRVEANPELQRLVGRTIITSDGTTLLGADDKSGVAVIMEAIEYLAEHPELKHGPIRVCFTCDEEIGHGVDHVDVNKLAATACYTLDGAGIDQIDVETFSADLATVTVQGINIHPSIAKGRMVNAVRVAADFLSRLPRDVLAPETTDGRQGFLHPYKMDGGVAEATISILLRDFDTPRLAEHAQVLHAAAQATQKAWPGSTIDVSITEQYRNMAEGLSREPRAVGYAQQAFRRLGREPQLTVIRGGTDGSRFTELGLPTPNLSTGEHNPHSPLEWTCLEEMAQAAEVLVALAQEWAAAE